MEAILSTKMQHLPPIELSYETYSSHKKPVHPSHPDNGISRENYEVGLLIPKSKKYIAWFTFVGEEDICLLLELNREKQVVNYRQVNVEFDTTEPHLALGTLFYGSLVHLPDSDHDSVFVIEDVLIYQSVSLRKLCFGDCLGILNDLWRRPGCLPQCLTDNTTMVFALPQMVGMDADMTEAMGRVGYPVHHVQYRSLNKVMPYLNVPLSHFAPKSVPMVSVPTPTTISMVNHSFSGIKPLLETSIRRPPAVPSGHRYKEPMGKERAVFWVTADVQSDIYHLVHPQSVYLTDVAYIPNYKTSVFMNSLFRNIKENRNLDAMEESDDEDDFMDVRHDKYVDLTRQLSMECVYHKKFRRWIPLRCCKFAL